MTQVHARVEDLAIDAAMALTRQIEVVQRAYQECFEELQREGKRKRRAVRSLVWALVYASGVTVVLLWVVVTR